MSKISDFISLIIKVARGCAIKIAVEPYRHGAGAMITGMQLSSPADLDRFLIEITSLADQDHMGVQLTLNHVNNEIKNTFQRFGFATVNDHQSLQMERQPQGVSYQELEFLESAPPGKKAERFIKGQKAEFKKRYGKRWKEMLYATAWKQFGETRSFKNYFALVECVNDG